MNKSEIVRIASETAIQEFQKQIQKSVKSRTDRRLRNTRLLLKNYPLLKKHCDNSVYNLQQLSIGNAIDILDCTVGLDGTIDIDSIKRSTTRTYIILKHIDTMLAFYEIYCQRSKREEDRRRYRIIFSYYFEGDEMSVIMARENIEERTYYRDMREGIGVLSSLIFGIDSLNDMSE